MRRIARCCCSQQSQLAQLTHFCFSLPDLPGASMLSGHPMLSTVVLERTTSVRAPR